MPAASLLIPQRTARPARLEVSGALLVILERACLFMRPDRVGADRSDDPLANIEGQWPRFGAERAREIFAQQRAGGLSHRARRVTSTTDAI